MPNYNPIPKLTPIYIARFLAQVDIKGENDCWPWRGWKDKWGYSTFRIGPKKYLSHRVSLAIVGIKSNHLEVRHLCNNPNCVNPRHLQFGTHKENGLDAKLVGKTQGSKNYCAKLTELDIPIIRNLAKKISHTNIGQLFRVSHQTIDYIISNKAWTHVTRVATDKEVKTRFPVIKIIRHRNYILVKSDIPLIRKLSASMFQRNIADIFGVTQVTISRILTNNTWKHVIGVASDAQVETYFRNNNLTID
jgi:hypothetical protein